MPINNIKNNTIFAVIIVILFFTGIIFLSKSKVNNTEGVVCTMEAKLCPDGSYVVRGGPKCEFVACPEAPDTSAWKTTTDSTSGVSFKYPEKLSTTYINTVDWPPQVQVIEGPFSCTDAGEPEVRAGKTEEKLINGHSYCVTTVAEGAAGSTYIQYAYAATLQNKTLYFTFTTRSTQCVNYDEPQKSACTTEREAFNIDLLVDQIIQTAHY